MSTDSAHEQHKLEPFAGRVAFFWHGLTAPAASIGDIALRRKARLLSTLSLIMIVVFLALTVTNFITTPGYTMPWSVAAGYVFLGATYGLSRTKHCTLAAVLAASMFPIVVFALIVSGASENPAVTLMFLIVNLLLGTILLPVRGVVVLTLANVATILLANLFVPTAFPDAMTIITSIVVNIIASALVVVSMHHRNQVERDRQAELRESEGRFRRLFEQSNDAVFTHTLDGTIVDVNTRACEMLGYSRSELLELSIPSLHTEDDRDTSRNALQTTREKGATRFESRFQKTDGTSIVVDISAGVFDQEKGLVQTIARDITDRKRAEETLRRRQAQLEALRHVGLELTSQLDLDALLHSISSGAIELLQGTAGGLYLYQPDGDVLEWAVSIGPNMPPAGTILHRGESLSGRVLETGEPLIVNDYQHWEGRATLYESYPWTAVLGVPVGWDEEFLGVLIVRTDPPRTLSPDDAELLGLLASQAAIAIRNAYLYDQAQQEIAQRGQAERNLSQALDWQEAVFQGSRDAVFISNVDSRFVAVNHAACELTGYSERELLSMRIPDLHALKDLEAHRAFFTRIMAGEEITSEAKILRKDGSQVDTEFSNRRVMIADTPHIHTAARDVTARKRAEAEREALVAELEAKNAELERFTYTVSHDLKSPLITIQGFLGYLEQHALAGDVERMEADISRISDAAGKMQQLLNELLELSRIGRIVNLPEEVSLGELAREAVTMVAGRLAERGVEVEIAPDLPVVCGDRPRLRQVLENLVDNAVKFMGDQPDPQVEIGVRRDGEERVFYVRDNGIGIDPRYQDRVFGLFQKLDPETEGSGVGLAIVRRIVEVHGGRIWVESEGTEQGSTFCFTLPAGTQPTNKEAEKKADDED